MKHVLGHSASIFGLFLYICSKSFYQANQHSDCVAIDEVLCCNMSKTNKLVNYNPGKNDKCGDKFYMLNCSRSNYLIQVCLVQTTQFKRPETRSVTGLVHFLMQDFKRSNVTLFCDRYYGSVKLANSLLSQGIGEQKQA